MNKTDQTEITQRFETSPQLQQAIAELNEAAINLILVAARNRKADPLVSLLLGISDEALEEYSAVSRADLIAAANVGAPIVVMRFSEPAVLRTLLKSGFASTTVLQALTKTMALPIVPMRGRK